jgi:small subunit ribosomal protein S10
MTAVKKSDDKKKAPAKAKAVAAPKKAAAPKAEKKPAAPKKEVRKTAPVQQSLPLSSKASADASAPKLKGIRIRLSAFDHTVLDETALKIIDTAMRTGAVVHGPIPLPTKIKKFTVNRSTFVHKDARDQFEMRIHRRLIDLTETTFKTVDALQNLSLPSGVDIEIRMG